LSKNSTSVAMPMPSTIAWWRNHHEMCKDRDVVNRTRVAKKEIAW